MGQEVRRGIPRHGLDAAFLADERHKSDLLLSAQLAREQGQEDAAADRFAEAAAIEERLAARCETWGLAEKASIHHYGAAGGYAQAGDFHHALRLYEALATRPDAPERLRQHAAVSAQTVRERRAQWTADLRRELAAADASA